VSAKASRVARVISIFSWVGWNFLGMETEFWFWEWVWTEFTVSGVFGSNNFLGGSQMYKYTILIKNFLRRTHCVTTWSRVDLTGDLYPEERSTWNEVFTCQSWCLHN